MSVLISYENKANETKISINHLNLNGTLTLNKENFYQIGLNRQRKDNDLVIYTPEFQRSTLTNPDGLEIIIQKNRIIRVFDGKGSSLIPLNGFIISATGKKREELLKLAKIEAGAEFQFSSIDFGEGLTTNPVRQLAPFAESEDIIGGVPELVRNGKVYISWEQEKISKEFVETKHPRTAIAKLKDGKFLMITVDGRSEESGGIGLQDLAELLLEMGAADAMNLDGGGSSTMFLNGKVINKPSDKEGERKVSDAILVFPRK